MVLRRLTSVGLLVVVLAAAAVALVFHLLGGHWFVVTTSSMGRAAPVGTLVLTEPTRASLPLEVGDVVSFRPPGAPDTVYTHRVASVGPEGIRTSGDTTGAIDPWLLTDGDVVGRAVALLPGLGWALRAAPWAALGTLVIWAVSSRITDPAHRAASRVLLGCLLVSGITAVQRPLVGVDLLSTTTDESGAAAVHVVSTGLAPVRVQADGGGHVDLVSGAVGSAALPDVSGVVDVTTTLHLAPGGWVVVAVICLSPLLWTLLVGLPTRHATAPPPGADATPLRAAP